MTDEQKAINAARAVIADLLDRRGLRQEFEKIDYETRAEIQGTWARLILTEFRRNE